MISQMNITGFQSFEKGKGNFGRELTHIHMHRMWYEVYSNET